jgi:hypothetical protein
MRMFYAAEKADGTRLVGLVNAVSLKHGREKVTRLYPYDKGFTSHEVSTKIADHVDELHAAGLCSEKR